jgi:hypothetical protein
MTNPIQLLYERYIIARYWRRCAKWRRQLQAQIDNDRRAHARWMLESLKADYESLKLEYREAVSEVLAEAAKDVQD